MSSRIGIVAFFVMVLFIPACDNPDSAEASAERAVKRMGGKVVREKDRRQHSAGATGKYHGS